MPPKRKIIFTIGDHSGNLTFIGDSEDLTVKSTAWSRNKFISKNRLIRRGVFKCDCGNICIKNIFDVKSGCTTTCGCKPSGCRKYDVGEVKSSVYYRWRGMISRCYRKNDKRYSRYGGRGIAVSDEFRNNYLAYKNYVESLPLFELVVDNKLSIDRIDNNKNYEIGNLKWSTPKEQANNRKNCKNA